MKFYSEIIIICALVFFKTSQGNSVNVPKEDKSFVELSLSIQQFSKIFMKYVRESQFGNYVVSPLSLHFALGLITIGSGGITSSELHNVLGTNNFKNRIVEDYEKLSEKLWTLNPSFKLNQKIWLSKNFIPNITFVSLLKNSFKYVTVEELNSNNTQNAVEIINSWSQSFSTGNFINLINLGLTLSSILSFEGTMKNSLRVNHTEIRRFFINERIFKEVPMMYVNGSVIHGILPEIKASFIKYEIKANELSMIIIHTNEIGDFLKVDKQLDDINISDILERGNLINMSILLPEFKIEKTIELKGIIQKMGIHQIFNINADFSGISNKGLKVDEIIQKISVDIHENGITVSGSTDIRTPKSANFYVNSPFHFVILHEVTKLPLIRGRITNPLSN